MDYFEQKLTEQESEKLPDWVSKKNKSYDAYHALLRLKSKRLEFIRTHGRKTDFKTASKSHEIRAAQVAREVDMSKVTLTSSSSYSSKFNEELERVNEFLAKKKEQRFKEIERKRQEVERTRNLRKTIRTQVSEAELALVEQQVTKAIEYLNNDVKRILLLPTYGENKITKIHKYKKSKD